MDILEKLNQTYLEDVASILPLHRLFVLLLSIPPVIGLTESHAPGVLVAYLSLSPAQLVQFSSGLLWNAPSAAWFLMLATSWGAIYVALSFRKVLIHSVTHSRYKPQFVDTIAQSAERIRAELPDVSAISASLQDRYQARKRRLQYQLQGSEIVLSCAVLFGFFVSTWCVEDAVAFLLMLALGLAIELGCHRYFVTAVAPPMMLHGLLTNRFSDIEDGY